MLFVAAGEYNSAAVTEEGSLFTWGYGAYGQLGLGDDKNKLIPTCVPNESFNGARVHMVSCSTYRSLAVTEPGSLWSWGCRTFSLLGHKNEFDKLIPTLVDPLHFNSAKIVTASAGSYVSTAVTEDGEIYSWGKARDFRYPYHYTGLGHTDIQDKLVPTRVDAKYMQGARVGRWHGLRPEHALAFAMGLHSRLGGTDKDKECSLVSILDDNLVKMVVDFCRDCTGGGYVKLQGVLRLIGGCFK